MPDVNDDNPATLAEMLIKEQTRRGITDREAAAEIGAKQQTYATWKTGRTPRPVMHQPIARFLRTKVGKLRLAMAPQPAVGDDVEEIKLEAVGESVMITRRGGGALLITNGDAGFQITTGRGLNSRGNASE